jgi:hypothetical protein
MTHKALAPNTWFRVRHPDGFSPETFDYFKAACRVCQARVESLIANWDELAPTKGKTKPAVEFLPAQLSEDRSTASLPMRADDVTLGSRALLHEAAKDLYLLLPVGFMIGVEAGITEPSATDESGFRNDWWNPHQPLPSPSEEMLDEIRKRGGRVVTAADLESELKSGRRQ